MTIPTGTILKVVAIMVWDDGEIMQNVFNSLISGAGGPWTESDVVADALAWVQNMYANTATRMSDQVNGSEVRVYEYDAVDDDWDEIGSAAWSYTPTASSSHLPRGVAGLLNGKTTDPDISGKKYVGGLTVNDITAGLLTTTEINTLTSFGIDWVTPFTGATSGADWDPGIWSVVETLLQPLSGTLIIPTIAAYQRRRKRGVGI